MPSHYARFRPPFAIPQPSTHFLEIRKTLIFPFLYPILPPMNPLKSALDKTGSVALGACDLFRDVPGMFGTAAFAAVTTITVSAFLGFVVTESGKAILGEIRRRNRIHAPHPASPSLRGTPTAAELRADCKIVHRPLQVRLRMGSRLADLEPTLDSGNHYDISATGAKRIKSRGRGMRGYIADNRLAVSYSTLMRYRLLALRLRRLLQLDAHLPLEWLLPGESPDRVLPSDLQAPYSTARRRLARLLREHRNFDGLRKHVDAKLGIPELLSVRRGKRRGKKPKSLVLGNYSVGATPLRLESTMKAFARFLQEKDLPPKLADHRNRFASWLTEAVGT